MKCEVRSASLPVTNCTVRPQLNRCVEIRQSLFITAERKEYLTASTEGAFEFWIELQSPLDVCQRLCKIARTIYSGATSSARGELGSSSSALSISRKACIRSPKAVQ